MNSLENVRELNLRFRLKINVCTCVLRWNYKTISCFKIRMNILIKFALTGVMKKCVVRLIFKLSNPFSTILFCRLRAEFIFSDSMLTNSKQKVVISFHNNKVRLIVLP